MTTEILAPSELALSIAVEEDEQELADEYRELSRNFSEHILMHLGGRNVDSRIAEACSFPDPDRKDEWKSCSELWKESGHDGRILLLEEHIQVLHLVRNAFNSALDTEPGRGDWFIHLNRMFPGKPLVTVITDFQRENAHLIHQFQCMINDLRCIRIGAFNGFWSEHDPLY